MHSLNMRGCLAAVALLLTATTALAQSASATRIAHGRELAERFCSNCHAVTPGSAAARPEVPSFATIAGRPGQTAERIAGAIIVPHPEMPTVQLTMSEIRDIVAYIQSLH